MDTEPGTNRVVDCDFPTDIEDRLLDEPLLSLDNEYCEWIEWNVFRAARGL